MDVGRILEDDEDDLNGNKRKVDGEWWDRMKFLERLGQSR